MPPLDIFIAVTVTAAAVSYGWGMRGFIIGGEKGALLPGALLGLCIAFFAADGAFRNYYPFFAAAGALSMFYGGTEPYAQTMGYILHRENYPGKYLHGAVGIFLKGALWFGIAACVPALLTGALSGEYRLREILILFISFPFVSAAGTALFNSPYNKKENKYPKIYFSNSSREEWGGNLFIISELIMFSLIKRNFFAAGAALTGLLFGGLGFLGGLIIYDKSVRRGKNGKYFFGRLQENGYIDNWKIMEHFFGAFSGGAVMLYFCFNSEYLSVKAAEISLASGLDENKTAATAAAMLFFTALQYPLRLIMKRKGAAVDAHLFELLERPFWSAFPLITVFAGSFRAAYFVSFITILYALCEKCVSEWYERAKRRREIRISFVFVFIAGGLFFILNPQPSPLALVLLYTFAYTLPALLYTFLPSDISKQKKSGKSFCRYFASGISVGLNFLFLSTILTFLCAVFYS